MASFRYCPICATPLELRLRDGRERPACPKCDYVRFEDPKVAVVALLTDDRRVLLVKRGVDPGRGMWALPGGFMDAGEMPQDALRREVGEETGFRCEVGGLLDIFPLLDVVGAVTGIVLAFAATPIGMQNEEPSSTDEVMEARWFSVQDEPVALAFESTRRLLDRWVKQQARAAAKRASARHDKEREDE